MVGKQLEGLRPFFLHAKFFEEPLKHNSAVAREEHTLLAGSSRAVISMEMVLRPPSDADERGKMPLDTWIGKCRNGQG